MTKAEHVPIELKKTMLQFLYLLSQQVEHGHPGYNRDQAHSNNNRLSIISYRTNNDSAPSVFQLSLKRTDKDHTIAVVQLP